MKMKFYLFPILICLLCISGGAIVISPKSVNGMTWNIETKKSGHHHQKIGLLNYPLKSSRAMPEEKVNVTLQTEDMPEDWMISGVYVYNEEIFDQCFDFLFGYPQGEMKLTPGEYDFCCRYTNSYSYYFDIIEKVNVEKDTTIMFQPKNITNKINFDLRDKADQPLTLSEVDPWTMEVIYRGNLESLVAYEGIYIDGVGVLSPFFKISEGGTFGTMDETFSIFISPVSERYSFLCNFVGVDDKNDIYVLKQQTVGCEESKTLKNSAENYTGFSKTVDVTLPKGYDGPLFTAYDVIFIVNGEEANSWSLGGIPYTQGEDHTAMFYVDAPLVSDGAKWNQDILVCPGLGFVVGNEETGYELGAVLAPASGFTGDGIREYYVGYDPYYAASERFLPDPPGMKKWFPGLEEFSFSPEEEGIKPGESVPFLVFAMHNYNSIGAKLFDWNWLYQGMLSDRRPGDDFRMKFDVNYNDEPIQVSTVDEFRYLSYSINSEEEGTGILKLSLSVDNPVSQSANSTDIISQLKKEDYIPPTLRMLQLRNSDKKITNSFRSNEEVYITLTAGDFLFTYDDPAMPAGSLNCEEPDLLLEIADNGSDNWQAIEMELDQAGSSSNFGYMYHAVYVPEKDGQFDMRITLTDASGNSQTQLLSNSFFTAPLGLSETTMITGKVDVYDITGYQVAEDKDWSSLNLPTGIYMIHEKNSNTTIKCLIK